jgi:hypothetical protein
VAVLPMEFYTCTNSSVPSSSPTSKERRINSSEGRAKEEGKHQRQTIFPFFFEIKLAFFSLEYALVLEGAKRSNSWSEGKRVKKK